MNMLDVFLQCLAIDQDNVQVCFAENIEVWAKGLVDISLEFYSSICESKEGDQGFKEAIVGVYGCLADIFITYPDKAIGIANVNLGNVFRFGKPGQCFSNVEDISL
jgi:hypothetical protein